MENAIGKFERISADNYEEFLKAVGVNLLLRKAATASNPTMEVSKENETWTITTSTMLKSIPLKFKLGKQFDETTPDGREVSSIVTQEGNKFVCIQTAKREGQLSTKSVRDFTADECVTTVEVVGAKPPVLCKQVFKRVK